MSGLHPTNYDTWGLFVVDGIFQIQRIDENPVFASDEEAFNHVYQLALKGDVDAIHAVLCHNETVETIRELEDLTQ